MNDDSNRSQVRVVVNPNLCRYIAGNYRYDNHHWWLDCKNAVSSATKEGLTAVNQQGAWAYCWDVNKLHTNLHVVPAVS